MPRKLTEADFWLRINRTDTCWLWTGNKLPHGYGLFGGKTSHRYAHRYSYAKFKGPIPDGMFVCHQCDEPSCVNPDHLFLGTQKTNMEDCSKKDRTRALLSTQDVIDARSYLAQGCKQTDIATFFGVSKYCMSRAIIGTKTKALLGT